MVYYWSSSLVSHLQYLPSSLNFGSVDVAEFTHLCKNKPGSGLVEHDRNWPDHMVSIQFPGALISPNCQNLLLF
jgi:hypothetical protein